MKNTMLASIVAWAVSITAATAAPVSFELDFGSASVSGFGDTVQVIDYDNVTTVDGVPLNARLEARQPFQSNRGDEFNGAVNGDIRVNVARSDRAQLQLSLFDSRIGDGYAQPFDPGVDFEWSLVFYDIDGNDANFDSVLLRTPGIATLSSNSLLERTTTPEGLLLEGNLSAFVDTSGVVSGGNVATEEGVTALTANQQVAAVGYTVTNTSTVLFDYIVGPSNLSDETQRNVLVDGGSLIASFDDPVRITVPVPLPAALPMLLAGLGLIAWRARRA